jgi:hypothetical protein
MSPVRPPAVLAGLALVVVAAVGCAASLLRHAQRLADMGAGFAAAG